MHVVVLAGGVGGARFLLGLRSVLNPVAEQPSSPESDRIDVIVNTGDDLTVHGLRVCPDLDTVMYTLGNGIDTERGWGRNAETWQAKDELAAYGAEPSWFGLGDRDIATHLIRTRMLDAGFPLTEVTAALCDRWQPGVTLRPMTDQRMETNVVCQIDGLRRVVHFQEWWIAHRAQPPVEEFVFVGREQASAAPGVLAAIAGADAVLFAPSNPVVSIGPILAVPGIRDALQAADARVVGISPIIDGAVVRGMADKCLPVLGVPVTAEGVGRHYGARTAEDGSSGGLLDGWLVHETDTADVPGVDVRAVPLLMRSPETSAAMAQAALDLCKS